MPGIATKRVVSSRAIARRQVGGRRVREDRERDLRADTGNREQELEELALGRLCEAVELERVFADVEVGVERDFFPTLRLVQRALGRLDEVADPVDVEDDAVEPPRDDPTPEARDHPTA